MSISNRGGGRSRGSSSQC